MWGKTIIGNGKAYRIEAKIGVGGYAIVYKAWSMKDEKYYAIKKVNLEFLSDKDYDLAK